MSAATRSSIWLANAGVQSAISAATFPAVKRSAALGTKFDVVVVGGGMFGCTTAYMLKSLGKKVALIEAGSIGGGVTSFSTAKLSAQQKNVYTMIGSKHNGETARLYYDMNMQGTNTVERLAQELQIECEFERRSHSTYTISDAAIPSIEQEYAYCTELGIPCSLLNKDELAEEIPETVLAKRAVCFPNQAQFNPYKFCTALARQHIDGDGSYVFENSRVTDVHQNVVGPHEVQLKYNEETSLFADHVVLATHLPILDRSNHFAVVEPTRSLCIAVRVPNLRLTNMFISMDQPVRSLRVTGEHHDILVVCGNSFPMGSETNTEALYQDLENWTEIHFGSTDVVSRWSAMDYKAGDHIPYMGRLYRGCDTIYTATGFSKWGLANGVAGAELVTDLILHGHAAKNPFQHMVDARRWDLTATTATALEENIHVAQHMVGDKLKHAFTFTSHTALGPNEGGIVRNGLHTVGAFRSADGVYHVVKPVCTHLGCDLVFNNADHVWDCPCHGSMFDVDGKVLHGPAVNPLCKVEGLDW